MNLLTLYPVMMHMYVYIYSCALHRENGGTYRGIFSNQGTEGNAIRFHGFVFGTVNNGGLLEG